MLRFFFSGVQDHKFLVLLSEYSCILETIVNRFCNKQTRSDSAAALVGGQQICTNFQGRIMLAILFNFSLQAILKQTSSIPPPQRRKQVCIMRSTMKEHLIPDCLMLLNFLLFGSTHVHFLNDGDDDEPADRDSAAADEQIEILMQMMRENRDYDANDERK